MDGRDYGEVEENDSVSPGASTELGSNKPNSPTNDQQNTFTDFVDLPDVGVLTRSSRRILARLTSQGQPLLEVGENKPTPEAKATGSKSCSVPRKRNVGNSKKQQESDQEAGEGSEANNSDEENNQQEIGIEDNTDSHGEDSGEKDVGAEQSTLPPRAVESGSKLAKARRLKGQNDDGEEEEDDDFGDEVDEVVTSYHSKEPGQLTSDEEEDTGAENLRIIEAEPKSVEGVRKEGEGDYEPGDFEDDAGDDVLSNHREDAGNQNAAEEIDVPLRSNERSGRRSGIARHPRKRPVWVKDKVEEEGPKLLGVGRNKDNQVVVVVQGLPSDLDSDVEMVKTSLKKGAGGTFKEAMEYADATGQEGRGQNIEEEEYERGDPVAKKKLKLVTVPASRKGAEYTRMFRAPYSRREEQAVINFLLERGGFSLRKGTRVWREMEETRICPGRSALALKQQFLQHIMKRLQDFGVTEQQLVEADDR